MKLKKILTASALSLAVSSSIFAACSADISMGGKTITHIGTDSADTKYNVATQGDLLAGSRLAASSISNSTVADFGAAAKYCASLADDGSSTEGGGNWRLPFNLAEASVAITGDATGSSASSTNYIWTADALNKADQAPNEGWSTRSTGYYLIMRLDGNWSNSHYNGTSAYAGCVR